MPAAATTPLVFVSYARADTDYPAYHQDMKRFIEDLSAKIAVKKPGIARQEACFFDETNLEVATIWRPELSHALANTQVGVALYSPSYFTSKWCGKEFQAFLDRAPKSAATPRTPAGIVPVLWTKCPALPPCVEHIQYVDATFPREYKEVGIQTLLRLPKVYAAEYELSLDALAEAIVSAVHPGLTPSAGLDLEKLPSAWESASEADPESHKQGSIAKTCFVFVSQSGWGWQPYPGSGKSIGAMAQRITGDLNLQYDVIPCDATLPQKLQETRTNNVPTILFGDPESLQSGAYEKPMRDYDTLYLLNCGALVPWSEDSKTMGDNDRKWTYLKERVFQQKTRVPPPNHEWRSIFSQDELEIKTRTIIENIRLRLLQQILADDRPGGNGGKGAAGANILKAENQLLTASAAAEGIQIGSAPQLEGPSK
jgi:hypothetical protein